jgi:flagellar basal-body rod protein FlgF
MNYGPYLSASGVLTNTYRQDVFANNLANVETVGFKRDVPTLRPRNAEAIEKNFGSELRKRMLDKLGGGVWAGEQQTDFSAAPVQPGLEHDAALVDPHTFFAVEAIGADGAKSVRLSRDGRFSVDAGGFLINAGGARVLDDSDNPIQLGDQAFTLDPDGRIHQNGGVIGQIQLAGVKDTGLLRKLGNGQFTWDGRDDIRTAAEGASVRPGYVEGSGVDSVQALLDLMAATKAVTANANMIRYHDQMLERAVNTLGRVA